MRRCSRAGMFQSLAGKGHWQEHRAVIHFQLPFAVRLEISYLIGSRLVVAATHQLAAYFGGFPDFQPFGYWQRFDAERVCWKKRKNRPLKNG